MGGKPFISLKSRKQNGAVTAEICTFRKHVHYNSLSCITEITYIWDDTTVLLLLLNQEQGKDSGDALGSQCHRPDSPEVVWLHRGDLEVMGIRKHGAGPAGVFCTSPQHSVAPVQTRSV